MVPISALILDDQCAYVRALARSLRGRVDISAAHDVSTAKKGIRPETVVALVDICLDPNNSANRDGLDFIRWLRSAHPDIAIVAMSALEDSGLPACTLAAGADRFLPKPLRIGELIGLLEEITERTPR